VRSGDWWNSLHAWQWWAQFTVAVLGAIALGAALAATARARYRAAVALMALAAACFGGWAAFLAPLGNAVSI
jgi:hypothetical protein